MSEAEEVIISEHEGGEAGGTRRVKVYDDKGDFFIDIPSEARMTFGYFNPAASGGDGGHRHTIGNGYTTMKTTCLRIYADKTDKKQIAAFLGVKGFRDESIVLTRIVQRVTVEQKLHDDGEGSVTYGGSRMRELTAAPEEDVFA